MSAGPVAALCDRVLMDCGIEHGFGRRGSQTPDSTVFSTQVHGADVVRVETAAEASTAEADALVTTRAGTSIGIVTADCVPILAATVDGGAAVAIHAGWRGMSAGVIEAGLAALRAHDPAAEWVAAVGPAARGCCYEVDAPVREGLMARYADFLPAFLVPGRPDRFQLDLAGLAARIVRSTGLSPERIGVQNRVCTICDAERFESYRRDGVAAGRLSHFIRLPSRRPKRGSGQG